MRERKRVEAMEEGPEKAAAMAKLAESDMAKASAEGKGGKSNTPNPAESLEAEELMTTSPGGGDMPAELLEIQMNRVSQRPRKGRSMDRSMEPRPDDATFHGGAM